MGKAAFAYLGAGALGITIATQCVSPLSSWDEPYLLCRLSPTTEFHHEMLMEDAERDGLDNPHIRDMYTAAVEEWARFKGAIESCRTEEDYRAAEEIRVRAFDEAEDLRSAQQAVRWDRMER